MFQQPILRSLPGLDLKFPILVHVYCVFTSILYSFVHVDNSAYIVSVYREDGPEEKDFQFLFLETEIKNSWEAYFEDAKQKLGKQWILRNLLLTNNFFISYLKYAWILFLAYAKDIFPPEFQYCIPINKTRSGMQVRIYIPPLLQNVFCGMLKCWHLSLVAILNFVFVCSPLF